MIVPKTEVYSLAKAFYHINNAAKHFESITANPMVTGNSRRRFKDYKRRLEWIISDVLTDLTAQSAEVMRKEVDTYETLAFDTVQDAMIGMTQDQRQMLEDVAQSILKGTFTVELNPVVLLNQNQTV